MAAEPGRIRGSSHQSSTLYLERVHGEAAVERCYAALDHHEAELLRKVRAKDWVALSAFCHYLLAADELYGQGDLALCRDMGHASAKWQIPGLIRVALRLFSPLQMINHIPELWGKMMDRGRIEIAQTGETSGFIRVHEYHPFHRAMCERLAGFITAGIELTGGRNATVAHPRCVTADNLVCEYACSWLQRRPTLG